MTETLCNRCFRGYKQGIFDHEFYCRMCVMLMAGSPPRIKTEATFQAAAPLGGAQFNPATRELYLQRAREAGVTTEGRIYEPRLAAYPGDPEAWISNQDDLVRVAEARNYTVTGDVNVKGERMPKNPSPVIADDLLEDLVETELEKKLGPDFVEAKGGVVERARDDVLQRHAPPEFYKDV